ncbi:MULTISPECIES: CAP domain-containing protein [Aerosakkonema]|uniref:CAP domain-containing protein n=1 Tax=Aerosakkonema TaxID=1246629 RepID=UPI0035B7E1FB
MQKRFTVIVLGIVVIASGVVGCDSGVNIRKIVGGIVGGQNQRSTPAPAVTSDPKPVPKTSQSSSLSALEQSIYAQINEYRKSRNLPPLTLDARISAQAKLHSQAMASGKVPFSHDGFEGRVKAISKSINYRSAAENVAFNQGFNDPATQAVQGWLKSPGHYKNIVGDFDLTGVSVVKNAENEYYFTQIFIRSARYGLF